MKLLLLILLLARPPVPTLTPQPPRPPAWDYAVWHDIIRHGELWLYLYEAEDGSGLYQAWPSGRLAFYSVLDGWRMVDAGRVR